MGTVAGAIVPPLNASVRPLPKREVASGVLTKWRVALEKGPACVAQSSFRLLSGLGIRNRTCHFARGGGTTYPWVPSALVGTAKAVLNQSTVSDSELTRLALQETNLHNIGDIDEALVRPGRSFGVIRTRALTFEEAREFLAALTQLSPQQRERILAKSFDGHTRGRTLAELYQSAEAVAAPVLQG
jgi:hypothetical protein